MDMLKSTCFFFLFVAFVFLSRSNICDSRNLGIMEKKLNVNLDHSITKDKEGISKLEAPSRIKTENLSYQDHAVVNHGDINWKETKDERKVERAPSDKSVSRTWKVPKYSKKQPKSDQEHPGFNLDYMQPAMHPPHHN